MIKDNVYDNYVQCYMNDVMMTVFYLRDDVYNNCILFYMDDVMITIL